MARTFAKKIRCTVDRSKLRPGASEWYLLDPKGKEYRQLGICSGPRVSFPDPDPKKPPRVLWVDVKRQDHISDADFEALLKKPSRAYMFEDDLIRAPVDPAYLKGFRNGCGNIIVVPSSEMVGDEFKGAICRKCECIVGFMTPGAPPEGTLARKAWDKANA